MRFRREFLALMLGVGLGSRGVEAAPPTASLTPPPTSPIETSAPRLPDGVEVGSPTLVQVPGDRAALVIHAPADNRRAILYLHGLCGDIHAVEAWKEAAAAHGTLIALFGDLSCGGGRYRWNKHVEQIEPRLFRAIDAVKKARGGLLDASNLVLFGYSQGADRAEKLAARDPGRFRRVVLGGPPGTPELTRLGGAQAVAVFGGELETTGHMRAGTQLLAAAGKPARFFLLPSARHGDFGPDGNQVIDQVLSWVIDVPAAE